MKKLKRIILALLLSPISLWGQAPVAPTMETSLSRIDSLTYWLYQDIPSHNSHSDSVAFFTKDKETFDLQMSMLGSAIPMDFHASVVAQIQYLMRMPESFYDQMHQRMQLYFPIFEQVLDRYNLPQELKYVSIIESNLNPIAQSWCGAMGLWQFMPYTGRSMGMRIDYSIDERKSIIGSTEKACEYFTNSFKLLNDWLLAISSYNCGAGNVSKAIKRAGTRDFWKVRYFLPKETQGYVPKFIAISYVLNFTKFAKFNHDCSSSVLVETPIDSSINIAQLSSYLGVSESEILSYNRELLKKSTVNNHTQSIMLPYSMCMQFLENKDSVYAYCRNATQVATAVVNSSPVLTKKMVAHYHYVKSGQTMSYIARKYGVTVTQLKTWNNRKSTVIHPGQKLKYYKFEWVNS